MIKKTLLLFYLCVLSLGVMAQDKIIKGKVVDEHNLPIPGANIIVKDFPQRGTSTNLNGEFTLEILEGDQILAVSFIGMETQEIEIGSSTYFAITLKEGVLLAEVVVTALGIEREAKTLGYAITKLDSKEITESSENNFANALAGKVAGVQISSTSGDVGSSTRITIRGVSSLSGNNQPLIVIDGVPIDNSSASNTTIDWGSGLNDINTEDIDELTVLKGASASALYGSRAANGVIVIKTKSGASAKGIGVKFTSRLTLYKPFILPDYQNSYGAGDDVNNYNYWTGNTVDAFGPKLNDGQYFVQMNSPMLRDEDGNILYDENGIPVFQPLPWEAKRDMDDFFELGTDYVNSFEVNKSGENFSARLGYTNTATDGFVYNTDYHKHDLTLSGEYDLTDKLKVKTNVQYHTGGSDNRTYGGNYNENPIKTALFMPANYDFNFLKDYENHSNLGVPLTSFVYPGTNEGMVALNYDRSDYYTNPFYVLDNKLLQYEFDKLLLIGALDYQFTNWLSGSVRIAKESNNQTYEDKANNGIKHWTGSVYSYKGFYNYTDVKRDNTTMNFMVRATKDYNRFSVNAFVGGEQFQNKYFSDAYNIGELTIPGFFHPSNAAGEILNSKYTSERKSNALFGSMELGYKKALFLEFTARNDWSSTLPKDNRSFFYPSVKLAVILNELVALPQWVSFLKMRGSWAEVGNAAPPYYIDPVFGNRNQITGIYEATISDALLNPTLKPERTTSWEVGLDARLFDGRMNLDATYYTSQSYDQIMSINVSTTTGYTSRVINVGQMDNEGLEIATSVVPIRTKDIDWEIGFNYTRNTNTVVELAEGVERLEIGRGIYTARSYAEPGKPYGVIYGYGFQRNEEGRIITEDGYTPRTDELIPLGNIMPDWTGGARTSFRYKNFTAGVLIDIKMGGDMQSASVNWLRRDGLTSETDDALARENGVIIDGVMNVGTDDEPVWVENNVAVPFSTFLATTNDFYLDESMIFDASYIKLKEVSLSYRIPTKYVRKLLLHGARISVTGRNLALLYSNVPHIDPETSLNSLDSGQGWEIFNVPSRRSVSFALTVEF